MNTQAMPVQKDHLEVVSTDQAYKIHLHYEREKTFSILMLGSGSLFTLAGIVLMLFIAGTAYLYGMAFAMVVAGVVLACRGFIINLRNHQNYFELVRTLTVTQRFTVWFNNQEYKRARKVLQLLATEEIFLSLLFATVLILLHLVTGLKFWQGIFTALLPVITFLLLGNAYRSFIYSRYSSKIKSDAT